MAASLSVAANPCSIVVIARAPAAKVCEIWHKAGEIGKPPFNK
jgi:hypothetical protein